MNIQARVILLALVIIRALEIVITKLIQTKTNNTSYIMKINNLTQINTKSSPNTNNNITIESARLIKSKDNNKSNTNTKCESDTNTK